MIHILFQDKDILVVDKPAGIPSQATPDPKRPHLPGLLEKQLSRKVFLQHRLDKDTSGVMIFGLSEKANSGLTEIFREHLAQKTYLCICKKNREITDLDFRVENHLAPVRDPAKKKMRMVSVKKGGWLAITDFHVISQQAEYALIEAKPKTGRTHQIRIHIAEKKYPILGDFLYGGKSSLVPRLMLHASEIQFPHPITKELVRFQSALPSDFRKTLENLKLSDGLSFRD